MGMSVLLHRLMDTFFALYKGMGFVWDDVDVPSGYSEVQQHEVGLETRFSRRVGLNIPFTSAAMDTITEFRMAVEIAKLGGLGVIHRGLLPEKQADHVARVKFALNGFIPRPICAFPDETLEGLWNRREEKGYPFHSFPVLDRANGKLAGLLTGNDFDFYSLKRSSVFVREAMTPLDELVTAPVGTSLHKAYEIMVKAKRKILPLVNQEGFLYGIFVFSDVLRIISRSSLIYNTDSNGQLRVGAAIGVGEDAMIRVPLLVKQNVDVVVIDTAHGDTGIMQQTVRWIKEKYPEVDVVAGNVSNGDSARRLVEAGADGIKVGQGPGSICVSRDLTGVGTAQLTAVYECEKAVRGMDDVTIIADGGISAPRHGFLALCAGADCVMAGRIFAGTTETPGPIYQKGDRHVKRYRGMGSASAMKEFAASRERYGQSKMLKVIPEGVDVYVPFVGEVRYQLDPYLGSIRLGASQIGAKNITEIHAKALFTRATEGAMKEAKPHDVVVDERITEILPVQGDDSSWEDESLRIVEGPVLPSMLH